MFTLTDEFIQELCCMSCDAGCPGNVDEDYIMSHNIRSFEGCTVIQGAIRILQSTLDGYVMLCCWYHSLLSSSDVSTDDDADGPMYMGSSSNSSTTNSSGSNNCKVNTDIAVRNRNYHTAMGNHMPYGITQCYLHPAEVIFPPLPQPKLVLDLATTERCKAELT